MKKLIASICILALALSFFSGCGIWEEEAPTEETGVVYDTN